MGFFVDFWNSAGQWSNDTFGPPYLRGPEGPIKHLEKEIKEIKKNPTDIKEYVDAFFLVLDAARRAGHQPRAFQQACWMKLAENQRRKWPNWKDAALNEPIEHIRGNSE